MTEEDKFLVQKLNPHFYQDQLRNISEIKIKAFYAVPKNRSPYESWGDLLVPVLDNSIKFHEVQFRGLSKISYDIFPEPFILEREAIFYDTENTERGNPEGLANITLEIEKRAANFLKADKGEFLVIAVIYEGVGASGTDGALILARAFLSDAQYQPFRSSLFYHEFGHSLGLSDQYDLETNQPFSNDIMGSGRRRPIEVNYIDKALLQGMGIIK